MPPAKIAFIGLGVMGFPMAGHLARAGNELTVYNRTATKAEDWQREFANQTASTPALAAKDADYVIFCVGNDHDLREVVAGPEGALKMAKPGALFIDHTTASAQVARELATLCASKGVGFMDAPISGGQGGAVAGKLSIMCGGTQEQFEKALPYLEIYGTIIELLGDVGAGQLCKMVNQICVVGVLQGLAEGLAFGELSGLNMEKVIKVVGGGAGASWQMHNRSHTMLNREFDFGFAVDWMRKDLGLVLNEARSNGARLPITALIDQLYAQIQANGGGRLDNSSLIALLGKSSGNAD
ncbi:NAD(P)-dependent oxidoreductase [Paenalcaligenes niemegkensis]|uniref:NAD(P)-dependent oxidoreductase n=1 Tax=Paenalcaligenes niemegkensis TaxID=2895469 RepID=UPI001EE7C8B6|nr:NAD(P)-dependent oxidoreductase [Paenalcaligenes niemegkensis]MCQ9615308.1 NAD(P)-dependent oxidoreductase [Paenalcaligenes niemegkensis]